MSLKLKQLLTILISRQLIHNRLVVQSRIWSIAIIPFGTENGH